MKKFLSLFFTIFLLGLSASYAYASAPLTSCSQYMPGMAYLCNASTLQSTTNARASSDGSSPPSCILINMPNALWCQPSGNVYLCTSGSWKFLFKTRSWTCKSPQAKKAAQACTLYPHMSYVCIPKTYTAKAGATCKVQGNSQILECSNGLFLCNTTGWSSSGGRF